MRGVSKDGRTLMVRDGARAPPHHEADLRPAAHAYFLSRSSSSTEMPCGPRMKQMRTPGRMVVGLLGELDALGLDLGGDRVDVLYRQPEMIQPLIGRHRRRMDVVAGRQQ